MEKIRHGLEKPLGLTREVNPIARVLNLVTRFKSTKRERAKIDKSLTNGKDSPWVGKALSSSILDAQRSGETVKEMMSRSKCSEHNQQVISFADISVATNCFAEENKLGEGGYGPVYKGKLSNGQEIAVKRLSRSSKQGLEEFKNEVTFAAKLQHVSLVKLLGFCTEKEEKMLIYEYMPNKSLDFYIFGEQSIIYTYRAFSTSNSRIK
nr:putative cysteine-rich receptor-like protein kinase 35 [Tanacetum cinerariifolium]